MRRPRAIVKHVPQVGIGQSWNGLASAIHAKSRTDALGDIGAGQWLSEARPAATGIELIQRA